MMMNLPQHWVTTHERTDFPAIITTKEPDGSFWSCGVPLEHAKHGIWITGFAGSGKTVALKNILHAAIAEQAHVVYIDAKSAALDEILQTLPDSYTHHQVGSPEELHDEVLHSLENHVVFVGIDLFVDYTQDWMKAITDALCARNQVVRRCYLLIDEAHLLLQGDGAAAIEAWWNKLQMNNITPVFVHQSETQLPETVVTFLKDQAIHHIDLSIPDCTITFQSQVASIPYNRWW